MTKHSLPPTERPVTCDRKAVIVIGAGLAGLSAAHTLQKAGVEVMVVEARQRPGGRVLTLREPFGDGLYAEAGPVAFADVHNLVHEFAAVLGLNVEPVAAKDLPYRYHLGGRLYDPTLGPLDAWPVSLTSEERAVAPYGLWGLYVGADEASLLRLAGEPSPTLKQWDRVTPREFFRDRGASSGALYLMSRASAWSGAFDAGSALTMLREWAQTYSVTSKWYTIQGGNDLLPRALAGLLERVVRYGAVVAGIRQEADTVWITLEHDNRRTDVPADFVVCAIPCSVLKRIRCSPPWPARKQEAINELHYESVARIFVRTSTRYWRTDGANGWIYTDLAVMNVRDATYNQPGRRGILDAYVTGEPARRLSSASSPDCIRRVASQLEQIYPGLYEHMETGVTHCWDEEEYSRGAYGWFKPGRAVEFGTQLAMPEGRVHFAGAHTSPWGEWQQGALESGLRAAREVIGRLERTHER